MSDSEKLKSTAEAVKGIVDAVPIYADAVQPAAREVGIALKTAAKSVHIALAPISALVWGYERISAFVAEAVAEKLKDVPAEFVCTPRVNVAAPALESMRFTGHEEALRDMYACLLATSMDARRASEVHPAFVEIIKQLTSDEAKIVSLLAEDRPFPLVNLRKVVKRETKDVRGGFDVLVHFSLLGYEAGCEVPEMTPVYIDNLSRLAAR